MLSTPRTYFLSGEDKTVYAPQSGQITGILKQMQDTRQSELDKTTAEEEGAIKSLDALVAAEEKQSTLWPWRSRARWLALAMVASSCQR